MLWVLISQIDYMWYWTWADHNIALMMKQTQSSLGRIMEAHLPPVKLKWLCLRIHPSVSLLSVTLWLSCRKDRKGMQFIKSAKGKMLVKLYCPEFWLIVYVASLIQSYSPTCFSVLSCLMMVKTWDVLGGQLYFLIFSFSAIMWFLLHWSLSSSSASSRSPMCPPPTCLS